MTQTIVLKDLLSKFLEKMTNDYELSSLSLSEKWARLSDSFTETIKVPTELTPTQDSSFFSNKAIKPEPLLRKQPSISENIHQELEREKNSSNFDQKISNFHNNDCGESSTLEPVEIKSKYYVLSKTANFLQKSFQTENVDFLNLNSYFLSTYILEMASSNELLIKCVAVSHFISLIMESFSSENHQNLNELYNLVYNKQIILSPHPSSIFSEEQLKFSFLSNFKKILTLRAKTHVSFTKLAKSFAYIIWQKPVFLESLVVFLKEMMVGTLNRSNGFIEKEMMHKIIMQLWTEPRRDLLKLLSETLNRTIEIYLIKDNRLEQNVYKPNLVEEKKVVINNKISLLSGLKNDGMWVSLILNISEKECFERLENLSKEEIIFLEEESLQTVNTSKSMNLIPKEKEKSSTPIINYTQEWKKSNITFNRCKEIVDLMNFNSDKMSHIFHVEKAILHPSNSLNTNIVNPTEFKENIVPRENDKYFNGGNKVERVDIMDRTRDKSRSRSPMIYYNQQNPYAFDNNRVKTITTITSGTYATPNPVIIDNRVRRHYTTNHLPTISNNIFSFN